MSDEPWSIRAWRALHDLIAVGEPFTADEMADRVGYPDDAHTPNAGNSAIGALFRQARAQGLIKLNGKVRKSRQPHRKGGLNQEWIGVEQTTLL